MVIRMCKYYHITSYENLESISKDALFSRSGGRSIAIGDKRCAIFLVALLAIGFLIQSVNNLIDNSKLKSRFKYVRLDGKKVEYKLKGSGDYTVIFDGSIGTNLYEWDKVCKLLEEEDKVATFVYNRRDLFKRNFNFCSRLFC